MDINKLVGLMEKIEKQDSSFVILNESSKAIPIDAVKAIGKMKKEKEKKFPYAPFVKRALESNFIDIAGRLRLDEQSINVGRNFIESVIEYKKAKCPDELNRFGYNNNADLKDTVLESTFNCIIESYGRKLRKATTELNKISGYNEEYLSTSNKQVMDEFEREIEHNTPEKINQKIADRVEQATQEFIEKRNNDTDRIKSIYNAVQGINNNPAQGDNMKSMAQEAMKANMTELRNKPVGLFESMVINLSTATLKDEGLKQIYMNEQNDLDIGRIVDDVCAIYAVMEECNVYGLVKMDKQFIQDFIDGFKN